MISEMQNAPANAVPPSHKVGRAELIRADSFRWMKSRAAHSVHAIVTDPPYGVVEFDDDQIAKMKSGMGGIWRIPPNFDGAKRAPLPRFTALNEKDRKRVVEYFHDFSTLCKHVLVPGGHVFLAGNSFLSALVFGAMTEGGLEFRGQFIRPVVTLRGGDRPKGAEEEFPNVCTLPKGNFEPWGLFRAPLPKKMTVAEALRKYASGGLRRSPDGSPIGDVLENAGRTSKEEKQLGGHPSQKPMDLMVTLVRSSLPLGVGVVLDPFMGSGTTIAAAEICGYESIGVEASAEYYHLAVATVPKLVALKGTLFPGYYATPCKPNSSSFLRSRSA